MRRWMPDPSDDVDLAAAYAVPGGRHVRANFVASLDGSVTLEGKSEGLSSDADRRLFHLLRALSDVILVGAGTVRAERYRGARAIDGRTPPPIAVVSRSLDLDPGARLFTDTLARPIVLTCEASPGERREALAAVADVVVAGADTVDIRGALDALDERGLRRVICEGGPHLLGWLVAAGCLDELCLTLSPLIAGGTAGRIIAGLRTQIGEPMRLVHVLEDSGHLFLRYSSAHA